MNTYSLLTRPLPQNTYETIEKPYKSDFMPFKTDENISQKEIHERFCQSPPIILCETTGDRNSRSHRHKYLFYPSVSRLSPYTDGNTLSNFAKFNQTNRNTNTNFNIDQEINRLRNENSKNNRNNEFNEEGKTSENHKRSGSVNYVVSKGKYDDLLNKSNELMNSISNLVKEEEGKIRGPLGYYNTSNNINSNNNNDYENFVNAKNNMFKTDNFDNNGKNSQFGKKYSQYQSGTLGNRRNFEMGGTENNFNNRNNTYKTNNNNYNNEFDSDNFANTNKNTNYDNNNENRKYQVNDKTLQISLKQKIPIGDKDNQNNDFNDTGNYKNYNNIKKSNNDGNDIYSSGENNIGKIDNQRDNDNKIFSNENNNRKTDLFNTNDYNSKSFGNTNDLKGYGNNNYKSFPNNINNEEEYLDNNKIGKGFSSSFGNERIKGLNENSKLNEDNNYGAMNVNENNNSKNNFGKKTMTGTGQNFNNNNEEDLIKNLAFSDNNINLNNGKQGNSDINNPNAFSAPNLNLNKNGNHSHISGDTFMTKNDNNKNNLEENNHPNKLSNKEKEQNIKLTLTDNKGRQILSEDRKPFIGEEVEEKKIENNEMYVITKDGEKIPVYYLKNYEGEYLVDENGNPILGFSNIYFIDKNGEMIFSTNKKVLEGDEAIPIQITKKKFDPYGSILTATFNSNKDYNTDKNIPVMDSYGIERLRGNILGEGVQTSKKFGYNSALGISGGGKGTEVGEYKRRIMKNRFKMFPKGDGDAKPPIIKKRRRKFKK